QNYVAQMKLHLTDAMQLRQRGFDEEEYLREAEKIKACILALSDRPAVHSAVRRWQDFFVEKAERLYQWCESAQIPAENNYAEREIRKVVIARKMSYGSQSEEGAKTREIWSSVLQTLKKREDNPRNQLVKALSQLSQDEKFDIAEEL